MSDPSEEVKAVKLTKAQRTWFAWAEQHDGVCHNPYSAPGAVSRWKKMVTKSVSQGLARRHFDQFSRFGGAFSLTDAGRASIKPKGEQDG